MKEIVDQDYYNRLKLFIHLFKLMLGSTFLLSLNGVFVKHSNDAIVMEEEVG